MQKNTNATNGLGRKRAEGAGSPSIPIEVFDLETSTKTFYPSMNETGRALGVASGSIRVARIFLEIHRILLKVDTF